MVSSTIASIRQLRLGTPERTANGHFGFVIGVGRASSKSIIGAGAEMSLPCQWRLHYYHSALYSTRLRLEELAFGEHPLLRPVWSVSVVPRGLTPTCRRTVVHCRFVSLNACRSPLLVPSWDRWVQTSAVSWKGMSDT
jgi:hypothetical protein